ncbi:MAG: lysylphosphatidylglycerol synthase transmembrane domain-containing protein [Actinomycetota bacterium]|nr:lysylphosphatidylglycerol synthase transmembrane domain-containing protein [Actinomycetota bacterium]
MTEAPAPKRLPAWLSFGMLVASIGLLVWFVSRDLDSLDALRTISPFAVVVILVLQGLYLIPESYRQQVVVESAGKTRLPVGAWYRIFVIGRFLNSLIPQSGNVYRALRLKTDYGIGYVDYVGSMVLFLMMSVSLNLGLASLLIAFDPSESVDDPIATPWALLALALIVLTVPLLLWWILERLAIPDTPWLAPLRILRDLMNSAVVALREPGLLVRFVAAWLATLAVIVALYGVVLSTVGASIGIGEIIALYALVQATSFVVITPGNLGIQELGFTGLAALFGVPLAQGAAAAAIIRASGWIALAIPALLMGGQDVLFHLRAPRE